MFALASNHLPANPVVITAIIGIDQESGDGMLAERLKKILRRRARPERPLGCRRVLIERMQNLVLLFEYKAGKFGHAREHLAYSRLQFRQTLTVRLLIIGGESGQAAIDEIYDPSFARPGRVIRWNDAGGNRLNFRRLFGSEEFEFRLRGRLRRTMGVRGSGQKGRPIR